MKSILCLITIATLAAALEDVDLTKVRGPSMRRGPEGRISGGTEAKPHSLPYQIGLLTDCPDGNYWCGGSLISPHWVITAAHCLERARRVVVFVGAHDIANQYEKGQQRIVVERNNFIIHEDWDMQVVRDDIALIYIPKAIQTNEYVQTIRLPSRAEAFQSMVGKELLASGWGRFSDYVERTPTRLLKVALPVITLQTCGQFFPYLVRQSNICTSGKFQKSVCSGDSGGPLVADSPAGQTLIGLTSFGSDQGCQVGWPAVFTRVGYYLDWISHHTGIRSSP